MSGSNNSTTTFSPGDIVITEVGNVAGATGLTDNQAAPIELVEINPATGAIDGTEVLPSTVSGEYGSSSEGTLEDAVNGRSLVIADYGVNYQTYNAGETGGNNTYGNAAEAQSYTIEPTGSNYTLVPRVVSDISANGTVDDSTQLLGIYNTQNPRSVATVNGSEFYLGGQGEKSSSNQGLFEAADGTTGTGATTINTSTDVRAAEIYNGQEYVSIDSKQNAVTVGAGTEKGGSIDLVVPGSGSGLPTGASTLSPLPGITPTITLGNGNGNAINGSTGSVNISPENFFFANSTTLYVADGGDPKEGGVGDGGLQKWSLVNGSWTLDYTLTAGLDPVSNGGLGGLVNNGVGSASLGDTGLIGLAGSLNAATGQVTLYATTEPLNDLGDTGLYVITDTLSDTMASQVTGETFNELVAGTPGSAGTTATLSSFNIRGVAFAPVCYAAGTRILTARGETAVEALAIGDAVVTASGEVRPIRWIGRRSYAGRFLRSNPAAIPVRFRAGSLGGGLPRRDLLVSPRHAMFLDGVLVPAECLIDGVGVVRERGLDRVDYFHIELDSHDVLLAEGAASESFCDDDSRFMFANAAERDALALSAGEFCAPLVESGPALEAIRARLGTALAA